MIFEMLHWWYASGWLQTFRRIQTWTLGVERAFSLTLLFRTLFAPWRRIITVGGKGLDARIHAMLDNLTSRCVGFVVRIFVIIAAGFGVLGALVAGVVMVVVWPLLPPLVIICIIKAIIG